MAISRGQIPAQIEGKLRGARGEKRKDYELKRNPIAKKLRSSNYSQKMVQSKKLYNRKKDRLNYGNIRDYSI